MATKSRRQAREGALRVLYEVEVGSSDPDDAFAQMVEGTSMPEELNQYAHALVFGVLADQAEIDAILGKTIQGYDFRRLAAIDRNVLRIGAFELLSVPGMPPAVSINEAIEIARKFSTLESGKFVNGVLGAILQNSAKADWDATQAPPETLEEPDAGDEIETEEITVEPGSEAAKVAARFAGWKLRSGTPDGSPAE